MRYYRVLVAVGVVLVAGACAIKPCDVVRNMTAAVNRRAAGEIVSWFAPNATLTTIHPNMSLVLNGSSAIASVVRAQIMSLPKGKGRFLARTNDSSIVEGPSHCRIILLSRMRALEKCAGLNNGTVSNLVELDISPVSNKVTNMTVSAPDNSMALASRCLMHKLTT
ncbi:Uncharacterized protein PBTT_08728 [Plasmodiophora brassicae]|uniref:Uncharacterized protein n=1 Tax=Plasmodiophora brassicae TaxID=37360 RepID=A0A0G4INT0_PLABS|nr:hypothetical protein PBRA_005421 [Plasmodiophora brassicae]SPR00640.1 unnamed protein product [Plasmodiophora brassicae]